MIDEINSYKKDHNSYKLLFLIAIICMTLISGGCLYYVRNMINAFTDSTYVSVNGEVYEAQLKKGFDYPERVKERILAAQIYYNYRYSGDNYTQEINLRKALDLCGDCEETVITNYDDEKMEENIMEKGWSYHCRIDSVIMDDDYEGYIFGKQAIRTKSKEIYRNIYIEFKARDLDTRVDRNVLAVVFDKIEVFNNSVIERKRR